MNTTTPSYAYYGHHKCATTWIRWLVDRICDYTGIKAETLNSEKQFQGDLRTYLRVNKIDFLNYTNASFE